MTIKEEVLKESIPISIYDENSLLYSTTEDTIDLTLEKVEELIDEWKEAEKYQGNEGYTKLIKSISKELKQKLRGDKEK